MAVGIIIGAAFTTVVKSMVDNVIMPPLGKLIGDIDFSKLMIKLGEVDPETKEVVAIRYGQFINDLLSFLIVAFVLFIIIKKFLAAFDDKDEEEKEEDPAPTEIDILTEIRDQLKKQNG